MGSITSRPKAPPPIAPQPPIPVTPSVPPPPTQAETRVEKDKLASTQRKSTLLRRNRSRSGTILTGLRGLLDITDNGSQRKTLLGE